MFALGLTLRFVVVVLLFVISIMIVVIDVEATWELLWLGEGRGRGFCAGGYGIRRGMETGGVVGVTLGHSLCRATRTGRETDFGRGGLVSGALVSAYQCVCVSCLVRAHEMDSLQARDTFV